MKSIPFILYDQDQNEVFNSEQYHDYSIFSLDLCLKHDLYLVHYTIHPLTREGTPLPYLTLSDENHPDHPLLTLYSSSTTATASFSTLIEDLQEMNTIVYPVLSYLPSPWYNHSDPSLLSASYHYNSSTLRYETDLSSFSHLYLLHKFFDLSPSDLASSFAMNITFYVPSAFILYLNDHFVLKSRVEDVELSPFTLPSSSSSPSYYQTLYFPMSYFNLKNKISIAFILPYSSQSSSFQFDISITKCSSQSIPIQIETDSMTSMDPSTLSLSSLSSSSLYVKQSINDQNSHTLVYIDHLCFDSHSLMSQKSIFDSVQVSIRYSVDSTMVSLFDLYDLSHFLHNDSQLCLPLPIHSMNNGLLQSIEVQYHPVWIHAPIQDSIIHLPFPTFDTVSFSNPSSPFKYDMEHIHLSVGEYYSSSYPLSPSLLSSYTITPSLPYGFFFDESTGRFYGSSSLPLESTDYVISAYTETQIQVSTTISLDIQACIDNLVQYRIQMSDHSSSNLRVMIKGTYSTYNERIYSSQYKALCIPSDSYIFSILYESSTKEDLTASYSLIVNNLTIYNNEQIGSKSFIEEKKGEALYQYTYSFLFSTILIHQESFDHFSYSFTNSTENDGSMSSNTSSLLSQMEPEEQHLYLSSSYVFSTSVQYSEMDQFLLHLSVPQSCSVSINNVLLVDGMNSGLFTDMNVLLPPSSSLSFSFLCLSSSFSLLPNASLSVFHIPIQSEEVENQQYLHPSLSLTDSHSNSYYGYSITIEPPFHAHTLVNSYSFSSINIVPSIIFVSWRFEGMMRNGTWFLLDTQVNVDLTDYTPYTPFTFSNFQYYVQYRLVVTDYISSSQHHEQKGQIYLSNASLHASCSPSNGYDRGYEDLYSYKSCHNYNYIGYKKALCRHNHYFYEVNTCHSIWSLSSLYPESSYYFEVGSEIELLSPIVVDSSLTFSIHPSLPKGLFFSEITGQISGTLRHPLEQNTYTITVSRRNPITFFTLNLYSYLPSCSPMGRYPETPIGETVTLSCGSDDYEGSIWRECLWNFQSRRAEWSEESNTCKYKLPSIHYPHFYISGTVHKNIESITPELIHYVELPLSLSQPLPEGLHFDYTTGTISGMPEVSVHDFFDVTVRNPSGQTTTSLYIDIQPGFCDQDGDWDRTPVGTTINHSCDDTQNYEGYIERECYDYTFQWSPVRNHCKLILPYISYKQSVLVGYQNEYFSSDLPVLRGGNLNPIQVYPSLPLGLSIDPVTGQISGSSTEVVTNRKYTVVLSNARSHFRTSVYITVLKPVCYKEGRWPETDINSIVTLPCESEDYEGYYKRTCYSYRHGTWGPVIDRCVLKMPELSYPVTSISGYKNEPIETVTPTFRAGPNYVFSIYPSLPDTMQLSPVDGSLSGYSIYPLFQHFTITLSNPRGHVFVDLTVDIQARVCLEDGEWPTTEIYTSATLPCENEEYYEGYRKRTCDFIHNRPVWSEVHNHCFLRPPTISYSESSYLVYTLEEMVPIEPTIHGLHITMISITPSLPPSMKFDRKNGVLSGTPTVSTNQTYTVTVRNASGSSQATFSIDIVPSVCKAENDWPETPIRESIELNCQDIVYYEGYRRRTCLETNHGTWSVVDDHCQLRLPSVTYPQTQYTFYKGETAAPVVPSVFGLGILSLTITPELPAGLLFNPLTGELSGTPSISIPKTAYTITVTNPRGSSSTTLLISIDRLYCDADGIWNRTEAGTVVEASCPDPVHYHGVLVRECSYESHGSWKPVEDNCLLNPPLVSYPNNNQYHGYKNEEVEDFVPEIIGLNLTLFTILPSLPNHLQMNSQTGQIYGYSDIEHHASYTVIICNPSGCSNTQISIDIETAYCLDDGEWTKTEVTHSLVLSCEDDAHYEGNRTRECLNINHGTWSPIEDYCVLRRPWIRYPSTFINGFKGQPIHKQIPEIFGLEILSIVVSPALPKGLVLDVEDGSISGTPEETVFSIYSITITNPSGTYTDYITFSINTFTCQKDGSWPVTEAGEVAFLPCPDPENYVGQLSRTCLQESDVHWSSVTDNCVVRPLSLHYNTDTLSGFVGDSIPVMLPVYSGGLLSMFDIVPELENGLVFDRDTGSIEGIPMKEDVSTYVISLNNTQGDVVYYTLNMNIHEVFCDADGVWNTTERSAIAYAPCSEGESGYLSRICQYGGYGRALWSSVIASCVLLPPSIFYEHASLSAYVNITSIDETPVITGSGLQQLTISPSLPTGLLFDDQTGRIYGVPEVLSANTYSVIVTNRKGIRAIASMSISVSVPVCEQDGIWKETPIDSSVQVACLDPVHYFGYRSRSCSFDYEMGSAAWSDIEDHCSMNLPTIVYPQQYLDMYYDDPVDLLSPTITGLNVTLSISPALPPGLVFNALTGSISGMPLSPSRYASDESAFFVYTEEYQQYTVLIMNPSGSSSYDLFIRYMDIFCDADGEWPSTKRSSTSILGCSESEIGNRVRTCLYSGYGKAIWSTEVNSCHTVESSLSYSQTAVQGFVGESISPLLPITKGTMESNYTLTGDLPEGLQFDSETGILAGTPMVALTGSITVHAVLSNIAHEVTLHFDIQNVYCAKSGEWNETLRYSSLRLPCSEAGRYGYKSRDCLYGGAGQAVWGEVIDMCQKDIPSLDYPLHTYSFWLNDPIDISPSQLSSIGSYSLSVDPALPPCLSFNETTGQIQGEACSVSLTLFSVTLTNAYSSVTSSVLMSVAQKVCHKDGPWSSTSINEDVTLPCEDPANYQGYLLRHCLDVNNGTWSSVESHCTLRLPSIVYPVTHVESGTHDPLTPLIPTIQGGEITSVSIDPSLPAALVLNSENGMIYGSSQISLDQTYVISVRNPAGVANTTLHIRIYDIRCGKDGEWPETSRGMMAHLQCPVGEVGYQSRQCLYQGYESAVWSVTDTSGCSPESTFITPTSGHVLIVFPIYV